MDRIIAWHGTNQSFTEFDRGSLGLSNPNTASRAAFFFARNPETAWSYAHSAARKLVPDHDAHEARVCDMLEEAEAAQRHGRIDESERIYLAVEELETQMISAPPAGARILQCALHVEDPMHVDGLSRDVITNLGSVLERARASGHDAVIIHGISDTPCGMGAPDDHIAVFDADQIEILAVIEFDDEPAMETELPVPG